MVDFHKDDIVDYLRSTKPDVWRRARILHVLGTVGCATVETLDNHFISVQSFRNMRLVERAADSQAEPQR